MSNRARLPCRAAAVYVYQHIELVDRVGKVKRLADYHPVGLVLKIVFKFPLVDGDLTSARPEKDSCGRAFPSASTVILNRFCHY